MKEGLWEETLDKIRENMPENEFSSWFGRLVFGKEEDGKITLYVPSAFVRDRFETTYKGQIESILRTLGDDSYSIAFEIKKNAQNQQIPKKTEEKPKTEPSNPTTEPKAQKA
ncbi:MAG: DnaA N-terminal domain-containing protein, partial [Spirochaetales bacterium]